MKLDVVFSQVLDVGVGVEHSDVLLDVVAVWNGCLGPELPLETHVFECVRKRVPVVDGNQRDDVAILVATAQNVSSVTVRVRQANIKNGNLVHFFRRKHAWAILLCLSGVFDVFLKRAELSIILFGPIRQVDERRRGNAGETTVIEQVRRNFTRGTFARLRPFAHTLAIMATSVSSRIVRSERFFVRRFEHGGGFAIDALQKVCATVASLRKLRGVTHE